MKNVSSFGERRRNRKRRRVPMRSYLRFSTLWTGAATMGLPGEGWMYWRHTSKTRCHAEDFRELDSAL